MGEIDDLTAKAKAEKQARDAAWKAEAAQYMAQAPGIADRLRDEIISALKDLFTTNPLTPTGPFGVGNANRTVQFVSNELVVEFKVVVPYSASTPTVTGTARYGGRTLSIPCGLGLDKEPHESAIQADELRDATTKVVRTLLA